MSKLKTLAINTPVGVVNSRTSFWLTNQSYNPNTNQLLIDANFTKTELSEKGKHYKTSVPFQLIFNGVSSFECRDYDSFEHAYGEISKSNFDQILNEAAAITEDALYLVWFYDDCFVIKAKGYKIGGF
jgi:hypothetical protein